MGRVRRSGHARREARLGRGDGTFGNVTIDFLSAAGSPSGLAVGDLNGDGIPDLVTLGTATANTFLTVQLGLGNGNFAAYTGYTGYAGAGQSISIGDVNNDGINDVVMGGSAGGTSYTSVRIGRGDGTFGTEQSYAGSGAVSYDVTLGDLNGDGNVDLLSTDLAGGVGAVAIRLGNGDGSFGAATSYASSNSTVTAIGLADLNSDGVQDLVTHGNNGIAEVRLQKTSSGVAPLLPFELTSVASARQALPLLASKREQLAIQRGKIGAFQSRIAVATNVLNVSYENFRAAESGIRDADVAQEAANLVRQRILQQASSAVLAQANKQPAIALKLLSSE